LNGPSVVTAALLARRRVSSFQPSLSSFWRRLIRRGRLDSDVNPRRGHQLGKKSKKPTRRALPDEAVLKLLKTSYNISGQRKNRRY
jgi:hypothetical protein